MTQPIFIAANQTASPIDLEQLRLVVPASSTVNLSDFNPTSDIQADKQLYALVTAGDIRINNGTTTLSTALSLQYLTSVASTANLGQPATVTTPGYSTLLNKTLRVASAGGDYTNIKGAVDAAVTAGASASDWWLVEVAPGTYSESPMTIPAGIIVSAMPNARSEGVYVTAANALQNLFLLQGGTLAGLTVSGVTDAAKACVLVNSSSVPSSTVWNLGVRGCSVGVRVTSGALLLGATLTCQITAAGQRVSDAVLKVESGSSATINGMLCLVPTSVLSLYADNPIQTGVFVDAGFCTILNWRGDIAPKDSTQRSAVATNGADLHVLNVELKNAQVAVEIAAGGSNTEVEITGSLEDNTTNFLVNSATGVVFAMVTADDSKATVVTGGTVTGVVLEAEGKATELRGGLAYEYATGSGFDMVAWMFDQTGSGLSSGGAVTDGGGLFVAVAGGSGFAATTGPSEVKQSTWSANSALAITASSTNYIYYNTTSNTLVASTSAPGATSILLAIVMATGSAVRYIHTADTPFPAMLTSVQNYLMATQGILLNTGLGVTVGSGARNFIVDGGSYYRGLALLTVAGTNPSDATFSYFYGTNGATEVASQTQVSITQYDLAGTLTGMTPTWYRADLAVITSDNRVAVIYGQAEYATQGAAETAALPAIPSFLQPSGVPLASLVTQDGVGIASIVDRRPRLGGATSTTGGLSAHSLLTGLVAPADDHTQYLLASGSRAMAGNLAMGGSSITGVNLVDGVDVSAHATRHDPGGADAIATATPTAVLVGASAAAGSAGSVARSDHQHGIASGTPGTTTPGDSAAAGSASSVARSDHAHALAAFGSAVSTFCQGNDSRLAPAGSTTQVQYNAAGAWGGAAKLVINAAGFATVGEASSTTPAAPAAGATAFARLRAGRSMLSQIGPVGIDYQCQPFLASPKIGWWTALGNSTTLASNGLGISSTGTATIRNVAVTNFATSLRQLAYVSGSGAGSSCGSRHNALQFYRGDAAGRAGFFYVARFVIDTVQTNMRWFVGMYGTAAVIGSVNPSTLLNIVGFGIDSGQTTVRFFYNDGSGTASSSDMGASFPATTANVVYEVRIYSPPNGSAVYYSIERLDSAALAEGNQTTDIPANTTLLSPQIWMNNGTTAAAVAIAIVSQYIETDN